MNPSILACFLGIIFGILIGSYASMLGYDQMNLTAKIGLPLTSQSQRKPDIETERQRQSTFADIFRHTGTDKLTRHAYDRYYDTWFRPYASKPNMRILEIGSDRGASLSAWAMFFDHIPVVHGLSYGVGDFNTTDVACRLDPVSCAHIRVFHGDQVHF